MTIDNVFISPPFLCLDIREMGANGTIPEARTCKRDSARAELDILDPEEVLTGTFTNIIEGRRLLSLLRQFACSPFASVWFSIHILIGFLNSCFL
jgi:hypothetical protein